MKNNQPFSTPKAEKSEKSEAPKFSFNRENFQNSMTNSPKREPKFTGHGLNNEYSFETKPDTSKLNRSKLGKMSDMRQRHAPDSTMYDDLINIILNYKKDIKFAPSAETYEGAEKYAKSHGLRLAPPDFDLNNDGIKDVVLYDKAGYPVVINGYHLKPSQAPFRMRYKTDNPDLVDRVTVGGFKGYMDDIWGVAPEGFNENGERTVTHDKDNLPEGFKELKEQGWRIPAVPRKKLSFHQLCMKVLGNAFKQYVNSIEVFQPRMYLIKMLPYLTVVALEYMDIVDRSFINANKQFKESIKFATNDPEQAWEIYKTQKKSLKHHFKTYCDTYRQEILEVCSHPGNFQEFFINIGFNELLTTDQLPNQQQYDELVGASKYDKDAKITLLTLRNQVKNELENRIKNSRKQLIRDIFTSNVDQVQNVDRTPPSSPGNAEIAERNEAEE